MNAIENLMDNARGHVREELEIAVLYVEGYENQSVYLSTLRDLQAGTNYALRRGDPDFSYIIPLRLLRAIFEGSEEGVGWLEGLDEDVKPWVLRQHMREYMDINGYLLSHMCPEFRAVFGWCSGE